MEPIKTARLYARIADRVVALMHERGLGPGARLPPEGDLARDLGVSRPAVREAMVALETAGFIAVRSGDGTFVVRRPRRGARLPWARRGDPGPGPFELLAARRILEPALAERAALAADAATIEALGQLAEEIAAGVEAGLPVEDLQVEFHTRVAEASGITTLATLVPELMATREERGSPMWHTLRERQEAREYRAAGARFRRTLVAALRARDGAAARRLVERHLEAMEAMLTGAEVSALEAR
jgi:DNA-binding FadR family transcriptional regulator